MDSQHTTRPALRVLVVDDLHDQTDSIALLLTLWGYHPLCAYDGPGALEAARAHRPDVALLDLGLPKGVDGYDIARQLRAWPETAAVRLVAITGYGQESDLERCREAGFDHHLLKPFDPCALEQLLAEFSAARPRLMRTAERRSAPGRRLRAGLRELDLRLRCSSLVQRARQLLQRGDSLWAKTQRLLGESAALRRLSRNVSSLGHSSRDATPGHFNLSDPQ
jgi:CheY-like chemotaxis protein